MDFASGLVDRAKAAGNFVKGRVGQLDDVTIFRDGNTFIVVDRDGTIRSFVDEAHEGGIRELYFSLLSDGSID